MKYIDRVITNITDDPINNYGNEGYFCFQVLKAFKEIFGNRITFIETSNDSSFQGYFLNGNGAFPTNAEATANANNEQSNIGSYKCTMIIDNIWSLVFWARNSYPGSFSSAYFKTPALDNSTWAVSAAGTNKSYTSLELRKIGLRIIEEQNFLWIGFLTYDGNLSQSIFCLKNNDFYIVARRSPSGGGANNGHPYLTFTTDLSYKNFTQEQLDDTTNKNLKLYTKFSYNYNTNNNNQVEISPNKIALINDSVSNIENVVVTTFNNMRDCSYLPADMFYTIDNEQYYTLNNYTLIKVNNGVQQVDTLVQ